MIETRRRARQQAAASGAGSDPSPHKCFPILAAVPHAARAAGSTETRAHHIGRRDLEIPALDLSHEFLERCLLSVGQRGAFAPPNSEIADALDGPRKPVLHWEERHAANRDSLEDS